MNKTEDKQMINIAIVDDEEFWRNKIREEIEKKEVMSALYRWRFEQAYQ